MLNEFDIIAALLDLQYKDLVNVQIMLALIGKSLMCSSCRESDFVFHVGISTVVLSRESIRMFS